MLLEILDVNDDHLRAIVQTILPNAQVNQTLSRNELQFNGVFTKWGLRSLSNLDDKYGTDEDYWRGSIWININYLALRALYRYKEAAALLSDTQINPALKHNLNMLYETLRNGLISNIEFEYHDKGYLFENYNGDTGAGQRNKGFSGWTALIANIIAEKYV